MEDTGNNKDIIYYYVGFAIIFIIGTILLVFYSEDFAWYYSLPMVIGSIVFLFLPTTLPPESKFRCNYSNFFRYISNIINSINCICIFIRFV